MVEITKCVNEWNATIEALGQGEQTILIRKYKTSLKEFLLYPTIAYTLKDDYLDSFSDKSFAEKNSSPKHDGKKFEVKYYAKVEKIIEKSYADIDTLNDWHIWTKDHVKSYLGRKSAYIWILRVYYLKKPIMVEKTRAMRYPNTLVPINIDKLVPVLSDNKFEKIKNEILNK